MNILFFLTPKAMCAYIEAGGYPAAGHGADGAFRLRGAARDR